MLYFLLILSVGVGIGCSISSSETKKEGTILRTEFLREVYSGYTIGWRYDRKEGFYDFSLKLFRPENRPPDLKLSWFGF